MFWKASVLEKTEGNKDFPFIAKLKVIPGKPSVLCYKKSKQKENRTEGNKGTRYLISFHLPFCFLIIDDILGNEVLVHFKTDHGVTSGGFKMEYKQKSKLFERWHIISELFIHCLPGQNWICI